MPDELSSDFKETVRAHTDILSLIGDTSRYAIKRIMSKDKNIGTACVVSTEKLNICAGKYVGKDDDRWLYLPALGHVKRIAASDERTSFVGSDFFYEDVSGRNPEEDDHELIKTDDTYYVVKSTPKPDNKAKVEFDSYTSYIHKATFLPVSMQFEQGGKVYREMKVLSVKDIQGYKTTVKNSVKDLSRGSETVLEYTSVKYDIGLPDDVFTERYLRNPPREHLE